MHSSVLYIGDTHIFMHWNSVKHEQECKCWSYAKTTMDKRVNDKDEFVFVMELTRF